MTALEDRIGDEDHLVTLSLELEEGDATGETRGGEADAGDETVDASPYRGTFDPRATRVTGCSSRPPRR